MATVASAGKAATPHSDQATKEWSCAASGFADPCALLNKIEQVLAREQHARNPPSAIMISSELYGRDQQL